jgi:hypothetical protein
MKQFKSFLLAGVCAFVSVATSQGSQVTWGAAQSNGVGDASGNPLPTGDLVLIGHFNLTNAQIMANGGNTAFLMANFVQYASDFIGDGQPNGPGTASDGYWLANSINSSNVLSLQNTQIYYWVFNSTTVGGATQQGIYTSTASNWKFPDDTAVPPTTITDLSEVQHTVAGILWGSFGTGISRDGTSPLYNLAPIPEPSTVGLVTFGLICAAAAGRRVRRS